MQTTIDEIADGIYRLSTWVPDVEPPAGFTYNQFLVDGEEPLLFHTGHRQTFPIISEHLARIRRVEDLRWITFGHVEADECGSVNQWLAAAPHAEVAHGELGCEVNLNDLCDRRPRGLGDGEVMDLGGKRVRHIDTPHVPHGWDARLLYEETTGTLLCGDLFTHLGNGPALVSTDLVEPAIDAEIRFHAMTMSPNTTSVLHRLADLQPTTLALMHGSSFTGDCAGALQNLATQLEERLSNSSGSG